MKSLLRIVYPFQVTLKDDEPIGLIFRILEASKKYSFDSVTSCLNAHLEKRMHLGPGDAFIVYNIAVIFGWEKIAERATLECMKHALSDIFGGIRADEPFHHRRNTESAPMKGADEITQRASAKDICLLVNRHFQFTSHVGLLLGAMEGARSDRCKNDACPSWKRYLDHINEQINCTGPANENIFSPDYIASTISVQDDGGCWSSMQDVHRAHIIKLKSKVQSALSKVPYWVF